MTLRPLGTRILIRPDEVPMKTESGLHLPEYTIEKPWQGTVISVGKFKEGTDVPPIGSKVHYRQGHGKETIMDSQLYELLAIEDVLGIIETGTETNEENEN